MLEKAHRTDIPVYAGCDRPLVRPQEVVLMGGGYHVGNWSAVAEFNIKVDPEAAHVVFNEPWPVTMVGLDLTHQALCTPAVQQRTRASAPTWRSS